MDKKDGEGSSNGPASNKDQIDHNSDATYKTKLSKKSVKSNRSGGKSDKSDLI